MMQEADRPKICYTNTNSNSESDNKDKPMLINNEHRKINYILPGPNLDNAKTASAEVTQ